MGEPVGSERLWHQINTKNVKKQRCYIRQPICARYYSINRYELRSLKENSCRITHSIYEADTMFSKRLVNRP